MKDILPGREGHVAGTAPDNQLFVEAFLYRFTTGIPWRDMPARFGYGRACISVSPSFFERRRCWILN
jgi:transposase